MSTVTDTLRRDLERLRKVVAELTGGVSSVGISTGGSGVSVTNSPITGAGVIALGLGTAAAQPSSAFDAAGAATSSGAAAVVTANAYTDAQIAALGLLYVNTGVISNTVANTTAETAFASSYSIAANSLAIGDVIRVHARGTVRSAVAAANLTLRLKLDGALIIGPPAVSISTSAADHAWELNADIAVWTIGFSGTASCQGLLRVPLAGTPAQASLFGAGNTSAASVTTTIVNPITLTAQWGTAAANNTITLRQLIVEKLR